MFAHIHDSQYHKSYRNVSNLFGWDDVTKARYNYEAIAYNSSVVTDKFHVSYSDRHSVRTC
jgi:hypothetical protein